MNARASSVQLMSVQIESDKIINRCHLGTIKFTKLTKYLISYLTDKRAES